MELRCAHWVDDELPKPASCVATRLLVAVLELRGILSLAFRSASAFNAFCFAFAVVILWLKAELEGATVSLDLGFDIAGADGAGLELKPPNALECEATDCEDRPALDDELCDEKDE